MWAMGPDIKSVGAVGGNYVLDDLRDTPDTSETIFDCPGYTLSYMVRQASGWRPFGDMDHGIEFVGDKGVLQVNRRRFQIFPEENRDSRIPSYTEARHDDGHGGVHTGYWLHKRNFLDCIRTREQPAADPEVGHIASIPGHLANISYRLNRGVQWDSTQETIEGDEEAAKLLRRDYREPWVI
jgi:predicted dehydrogenase